MKNHLVDFRPNIFNYLFTDQGILLIVVILCIGIFIGVGLSSFFSRK